MCMCGTSDMICHEHVTEYAVAVIGIFLFAVVAAALLLK